MTALYVEIAAVGIMSGLATMHSELRQALHPARRTRDAPSIQVAKWQWPPVAPLASLVSGEQIALEVAELRRESCKVFRFGIDKPHCASRGGEIP